MEIMLDDTDMAVAEAIGLLGEVERFGEIGLRRLFFRSHIGEELYAELQRLLRAGSTGRTRRRIRPAVCRSSLPERIPAPARPRPPAKYDRQLSELFWRIPYPVSVALSLRISQ